jgi:hypothetical protein
MPSRRRRRRFWRSECGQSTAFVTAMLLVLMLFVATVADVGQAVNRRVALQVAADAGAYTGASVMAVGLNNIAYWNKWIQTAWAAMTWGILGMSFSYLECDTSKSLADLYNGVRDFLGILIGLINFSFMTIPALEARRVSVYNLADLTPREMQRGRISFAQYFESFGEFQEVPIPARRNFIPLPTFGQGDSDWGLYRLEQVPNGTSARGHIPATSGSRRNATWVCIPKYPPPFDVPFRSSSFDVWYRKRDGDGVFYYVWIVRARATTALMFDSLFGGNIIPAMTAVAVAKPVGGSVERGESEYKAKMVQVKKAMVTSFLPGALPGIIRDPYRNNRLPGIGGTLRPVTH